MPRDLPYFQWYPADAETDEVYASMTDEELGFYHRLLNKSWINVGIPADLNDLACLMHMRRTKVEKLWKRRVGRCFQPMPGNLARMVNERQEEERAKAIGKSDKNSDAPSHNPERKHPGFIYLIRRSSDGAVKIGSAKRVSTRLAQLQYKYRPEALTLLNQFSVESMGDVECFLHDKYRSVRVDREWFRLSEGDMEAIRIAIETAIVSPIVREADSDAYRHTPRALARAESVSESESLAFQEFWSTWPLKQRRAAAWRMWGMVVHSEAIDLVKSCRDRYLLSQVVANGKVQNLDTWLEDQARNAWAGDWPKVLIARAKQYTAANDPENLSSLPAPNPRDEIAAIRGLLELEHEPEEVKEKLRKRLAQLLAELEREAS